MDNLDFLLEMGFPKEKVEEAVKKANNDIQRATELLIAEAEASTPSTSNASEPAQETQNTKEGEENADENAEAKSIKCSECGKIFKNTDEVEFHAVKSGHSAFEESSEEKKPLTEEEKKEKLKELEDKLKARRREKEEMDRKESIDREKKRIQMSRDISEIKRKTEEKEIQRLVDERKREKMEDKLAREKVKRQIEMDREARRQKFAGSDQVKTPEVPVAQPAPAPAAPKTYDTTRLQIRLPTGTPLINQFQSKEPLAAVKLWISLNRTDGVDSSANFDLATSFPRKVFSASDLEAPLNVLGLVPSATLMVVNI